MKYSNSFKGILVRITVVCVFMFSFLETADATSQWSRRTGMSCSACHTVFPRLNSFGEEFLRNGYQLESARAADSKDYEANAGDVWVDDVSNLLGFRLNMTPFMMETNSFVQDSGIAKSSKYTFGNPHWIQFFVAGPIYKDISFFSELEYAAAVFKFNWFYFNFTNVMGSELVNFQVGNISPVEFASYPDRLPQLSNIKGEVFHVKSSNGGGENSTKIRDVHSGIQYYGKNDFALWYGGISPGKAASSISQFNEYWGGLVLKLNSGVLDGSTATLHYQTGTNTSNTGTQIPEKKQITDDWVRIVPSVNLRYNGFDVQAAYMMATDKNWALVSNPTKDFNYSGLALESGYMPNEKWHFGLHFDQYASEDKIVGGINDGKPVFEYMRVVPVVTYIVNQNIRFSTYYEKDLTADRFEAAGKVKDLVDKFYLNIRVMY